MDDNSSISDNAYHDNGDTQNALILRKYGSENSEFDILRKRLLQFLARANPSPKINKTLLNNIFKSASIWIDEHDNSSISDSTYHDNGDIQNSLVLRKYGSENSELGILRKRPLQSLGRTKKKEQHFEISEKDNFHGAFQILVRESSLETSTTTQSSNFYKSLPFTNNIGKIVSGNKGQIIDVGKLINDDLEWTLPILKKVDIYNPGKRGNFDKAFYIQQKEKSANGTNDLKHSSRSETSNRMNYKHFKSNSERLLFTEVFNLGSREDFYGAFQLKQRPDFVTVANNKLMRKKMIDKISFDKIKGKRNKLQTSSLRADKTPTQNGDKLTFRVTDENFRVANVKNLNSRKKSKMHEISENKFNGSNLTFKGMETLRSLSEPSRKTLRKPYIKFPKNQSNLAVKKRLKNIPTKRSHLKTWRDVIQNPFPGKNKVIYKSVVEVSSVATGKISSRQKKIDEKSKVIPHKNTKDKLRTIKTEVKNPKRIQSNKLQVKHWKEANHKILKENQEESKENYISPVNYISPRHWEELQKDLLGKDTKKIINTYDNVNQFARKDKILSTMKKVKSYSFGLPTENPDAALNEIHVDLENIPSQRVDKRRWNGKMQIPTKEKIEVDHKNRVKLIPGNTGSISFSSINPEERLKQIFVTLPLQNLNEIQIYNELIKENITKTPYQEHYKYKDTIQDGKQKKGFNKNVNLYSVKSYERSSKYRKANPPINEAQIERNNLKEVPSIDIPLKKWKVTNPKSDTFYTIMNSDISPSNNFVTNTSEKSYNQVLKYKKYPNKKKWILADINEHSTLQTESGEQENLYNDPNFHYYTIKGTGIFYPDTFVTAPSNASYRKKGKYVKRPIPLTPQSFEDKKSRNYSLRFGQTNYESVRKNIPTNRNEQSTSRTLIGEQEKLYNDSDFNYYSIKNIEITTNMFEYDTIRSSKKSLKKEIPGSQEEGIIYNFTVGKEYEDAMKFNSNLRNYHNFSAMANKIKQNFPHNAPFLGNEFTSKNPLYIHFVDNSKFYQGKHEKKIPLSNSVTDNALLVHYDPNALKGKNLRNEIDKHKEPILKSNFRGIETKSMIDKNNYHPPKESKESYWWYKFTASPTASHFLNTNSFIKFEPKNFKENVLKKPLIVEDTISRKNLKELTNFKKNLPMRGDFKISPPDTFTSPHANIKNMIRMQSERDKNNFYLPIKSDGKFSKENYWWHKFIATPTTFPIIPVDDFQNKDLSTNSLVENLYFRSGRLFDQQLKLPTKTLDQPTTVSNFINNLFELLIKEEAKDLNKDKELILAAKGKDSNESLIFKDDFIKLTYNSEGKLNDIDKNIFKRNFNSTLFRRNGSDPENEKNKETTSVRTENHSPVEKENEKPFQNNWTENYIDKLLLKFLNEEKQVMQKRKTLERSTEHTRISNEMPSTKTINKNTSKTSVTTTFMVTHKNIYETRDKVFKSNVGNIFEKANKNVPKIWAENKSNTIHKNSSETSDKNKINTNGGSSSKKIVEKGSKNSDKNSLKRGINYASKYLNRKELKTVNKNASKIRGKNKFKSTDKNMYKTNLKNKYKKNVKKSFKTSYKKRRKTTDNASENVKRNKSKILHKNSSKIRDENKFKESDQNRYITSNISKSKIGSIRVSKTSAKNTSKPINRNKSNNINKNTSKSRRKKEFKIIKNVSNEMDILLSRNFESSEILDVEKKFEKQNSNTKKPKISKKRKNILNKKKNLETNVSTSKRRRKQKFKVNETPQNVLNQENIFKNSTSEMKHIKSILKTIYKQDNQSENLATERKYYISRSENTEEIPVDYALFQNQTNQEKLNIVTSAESKYNILKDTDEYKGDFSIHIKDEISGTNSTAQKRGKATAAENEDAKSYTTKEMFSSNFNPETLLINLNSDTGYNKSRAVSNHVEDLSSHFWNSTAETKYNSLITRNEKDNQSFTMSNSFSSNLNQVTGQIKIRTESTYNTPTIKSENKFSDYVFFRNGEKILKAKMQSSEYLKITPERKDDNRSDGNPTESYFHSINLDQKKQLIKTTTERENTENADGYQLNYSTETLTSEDFNHQLLLLNSSAKSRYTTSKTKENNIGGLFSKKESKVIERKNRKQIKKKIPNSEAANSYNLSTKNTEENSQNNIDEGLFSGGVNRDNLSKYLKPRKKHRLPTQIYPKEEPFNIKNMLKKHKLTKTTRHKETSKDLNLENLTTEIGNILLTQNLSLEVEPSTLTTKFERYKSRKTIRRKETSKHLNQEILTSDIGYVLPTQNQETEFEPATRRKTSKKHKSRKTAR
ncbi:hypothetical protein NPIL_56411, partial [Nephila pilipes]